MKYTKYLQLIVLSLILMTAIACEEAGPKPTPTPVVFQDVNLRSMLDLVEGNKVAAESKYKGMWVKLNGIIVDESIREDKFEIIPTDSDMFQMSGAECKLTDEEKSKVIGLRSGQKVTVKGQIKSISTTFVTSFNIENCQILCGY